MCDRAILKLSMRTTCEQHANNVCQSRTSCVSSLRRGQIATTALAWDMSRIYGSTPLFCKVLMQQPHAGKTVIHRRGLLQTGCMIHDWPPSVKRQTSNANTTCASSTCSMPKLESLRPSKPVPKKEPTFSEKQWAMGRSRSSQDLLATIEANPNDVGGEAQPR